MPSDWKACLEDSKRAVELMIANSIHGVPNADMERAISIRNFNKGYAATFGAAETPTQVFKFADDIRTIAEIFAANAKTMADVNLRRAQVAHYVKHGQQRDPDSFVALGVALYVEDESLKPTVKILRSVCQYPDRVRMLTRHLSIVGAILNPQRALII